MKDLGKNPCLRTCLWSLGRYTAYTDMTCYAEIQNSRAALFFGIGLGDKQTILNVPVKKTQTSVGYNEVPPRQRHPCSI